MNIRKLFFAWGITVVTGILTLPVYADLVIADNGSSDFVIEIDPRASAPEQNAARELQTYLQAISGVELPIVSSLPEGKHAIVVGRRERARQTGINRVVNLSLASDGKTYQLYSIGRCKPSGKTYLYCAASNNVPVAIAGFVLVKSKDIP